MAEKQEILVTMATNLQEILHEHMEKRISSAGYKLNAIYSDTPLEDSRLRENIKNAAGFIVSLEKVNDDLLKAAAQLKVVSKYGVGTDNIDIPAAEKNGVEVANCPGSNSNAVAELVIGLMISMSRNTQNLCDRLRDGRWSTEVGFEIAGKRVGILGFGNIGRKVAKYLKPFTQDILVYDVFVDRKAEAEYGVRYTSVDEIVETSDYITLHLPLLPETRHLINKDKLARMKKGVYLINAARGGVVDEDALFDAVTSGRVAGAGVDAFEFEPPTASRMLEDERFIVLPHIGAATVEASFNMVNMAIDNVVSVLDGKGNPHPVRMV
jgi:D-3-phosphoglycerate dehydrogenase